MAYFHLSCLELNCLRIMTESELLLTLARPADAAVIAEMSRRFVEYGLRWSWTSERILKSIGAANVNVLLARIGGQVAGFAIMRYGDDSAHLDLLAVAPPFRRAGVGRRLVEWLEECAVTAGIFRATLEVRAGNRGAQRFYERMGYRVESRLAGYYQGVEDALCMGRDLTRRPSSHRSAEKP